MGARSGAATQQKRKEEMKKRSPMTPRLPGGHHSGRMKPPKEEKKLEEKNEGFNTTGVKGITKKGDKVFQNGRQLTQYGISQLNKKDGAFSDKAAREKLTKATTTSAGSGLVSGVKTTIYNHYDWRSTLDEKCWAGYEKKGMKTMFGKRYPNCVKKSKKKK